MAPIPNGMTSAAAGPETSANICNGRGAKYAISYVGQNKLKQQ